MKQEEDVKIRPYARLLTMLGDQLIKNEQTAVVELIKNSYDADAEWVKITFENFGSNYELTKDSKIIIEDNGVGMTKEIVKTAWMNPATPNKFARNGVIIRSKSGKRIIQGEKGIGRFAMLKLGTDIKMTTRPVDSNSEYCVHFDLSGYDDNFLSSNFEKKGIFLDELNFILEEKTPSHFIDRNVVIDGINYRTERNTHGTRIEISSLRGKWSKRKITDILDSFTRFTSIFDEINENYLSEGMRIAFFKDDKQIIGPSGTKINLQNLLNQKAVIKITEGHFDSKIGVFKYKFNSVKREVKVDSPLIQGLRAFKLRFTENGKTRTISDFGDFDFDFYIFDFNAKGASPYALSVEQKDLIKSHRIYLFRDGIRVLPYGDQDDDWLKIDTNRGTISAGQFFSNDQITGRIKITKSGNPHLKDKTSREGLIDDEEYTEDFKCIISAFLSLVRLEEYKQYLDKEKMKKNILKINEEKQKDTFSLLEERYKNDKEGIKLIKSLREIHKSEYSFLNSRIDRAEGLAAVGLSVETSSHDLMSMLLTSCDIIHSIKSSLVYNDFDLNTLKCNIDESMEIHIMMKGLLSDLQGLFVSSKQKQSWQLIQPLIQTIVKIYIRILKKKNIEIEVDYINGELTAYCIDADIMQTLINLIDNSIYWLEVVNKPDKRIKILVDGAKSTLTFSDNGPGIQKEDRDYIFECFYSTKGEEGRGLGLYISQRLLGRSGNVIRLAEKHEELMDGANFIVNFKEKE